MSDSFYRAFEDRHRGSRELIKSRLRAYADFIAPLSSLYRPAAALDLGCGRGEWLELLGEAGFVASGVDLDEGMLAACRERALNVEMADAVTSLRDLPNDSVALVSAFHLVEHMPFAEVQALIREALRVLQPGGLLIMETPNPENLVVGASSFYMDPSHVRPVPPPLLDFVVEYSGFMRHKVVRLQESAQLHTAAPIGLINVLDGVSPDYAVVGQKSAAPAVLAPFDAPFQADYGIALADIAVRYERQEEQRRAELHVGLAQLNERISHSDLRNTRAIASVRDGMAQLEKSKLRIAGIEERMHQAEAHATQLEQRIIDVLASSSWRITASLRLVASGAHQLRATVGGAWIINGSKRCIKALVRNTGPAILRRPYLKKAIIGMLDRMPGLRNRLYGIMHVQENALDATLTAMVPKHLSPRAMHIYTELKNLIDREKN